MRTGEVMDSVWEVIATAAEAPTDAQVFFQALENVVCNYHCISPEQLYSHRRAAEYVNARRDMAVIARHFDYSYPVIGLYMCRDHTSIMNLVRTK
jgi:chromosomal replication initiation ATPase DnaA